MTILPYPDQVAALGNGAIDATVMLEPLVTRAVQTGVGVRLNGVDEFYPDYQAAEILYGPVFAQAKAARRGQEDDVGKSDQERKAGDAGEFRDLNHGQLRVQGRPKSVPTPAG